LTAALVLRQGLSERWDATPADAIRRLTPLQAQHPPAPYLALGARLRNFQREHLEAAITQRSVIKTTVNRHTLHLVHHDDYPAFAQLTRQSRMRAWRNRYAHLDEERTTDELTEFFQTPRTNPEIRERVLAYEPDPAGPWTAVMFVRDLLPLIQLPPAGHWDDPRRAAFVVDPRPLPDPPQAARTVLTRYLAAFGPASKKDAASWAGVAQRDFDFQAIDTVTYRDEHGTLLYDLPDQPIEAADRPPRFLGHWDQALLAYKDRDRILPPEVKRHDLTITGDPTVTVDGRVAGIWAHKDDRLTITPLVKLSKRQRVAIEEEAQHPARLCGALHVELHGDPA
jgi:hypothetical protein